MYDEAINRRTVRTDTGETFTATFLVTALGLLSKTDLPDISGRGSFAGTLVHTGAYPEELSIEGKRVGVIGTGSTGTPFICVASKQAAHLTVFQRSAQYSVPCLVHGRALDLQDDVLPPRSVPLYTCASDAAPSRRSVLISANISRHPTPRFASGTGSKSLNSRTVTCSCRFWNSATMSGEHRPGRVESICPDPA